MRGLCWLPILLASWYAQALPAEVIINEFMAVNQGGHRDEDGDSSDWIELFNRSSNSVALTGWYLTDSRPNLARWRLPATNLAPNGFLLVFASGKDRAVAGGPLHTNFKLSDDGEYLALVRPDGVTIASEFAPAYPPQFPNVSFGASADNPGVYLQAPTPAAPNSGLRFIPGPTIASVVHSPLQPKPGESILVQAVVRPNPRPIQEVHLDYYQVLTGRVSRITMFDDGQHGDGLTGDGLFAATISGATARENEMIRWQVEAFDVGGGSSRYPETAASTAVIDWPGTMVASSQPKGVLPIFYLAGLFQAGSVYHDGEYYYPVYTSQRNAGSVQPKNSYRLTFPLSHMLRHSASFRRTSETSLLAEAQDPSYLREYLTYWLLSAFGSPAPYHYPVELRLNGQFFQLAFHSEDLGAEQLERFGYDPAGALYEEMRTLTGDIARASQRKLTRLWENNVDDYRALVEALAVTRPVPERRARLFDLIDVPEVINYMVVARFVQETGDINDNMTVYRDSDGDRLWRVLPRGMRNSWGALSTGYTTPDDGAYCFPLLGTLHAGSSFGFLNALYNAILEVPETRSMFLCRLRTLLDWAAPPTGSSPVELEIQRMRNQITGLVAADRLARQCGTNLLGGCANFGEAVDGLVTNFFRPRVRFLLTKHSVTNTALPLGLSTNDNAGIPLPTPADVAVDILHLEISRTFTGQAEEFVCLTNPNPYAVDLTSWALGGTVQFDLRPGTVLPGHGLLFVSPNVGAFRNRSTGPRGGLGLFVVGNYEGDLSWRNSAVSLINRGGQVVSTRSFQGAPSTAQAHLRITELLFHPTLPPDSVFRDPSDFEFIELMNIGPNTLDLTGVHFTDGVSFTFSGSAVANLAPNERVVVARNLAAFRGFYGSDILVAGEFGPSELSDDGERLRLVDAGGDVILDFTYLNSWQRLAAGMGFALVMTNVHGPFSAWNDPASWRAGTRPEGSPGRPDPDPIPVLPVWINEVLSHAEPPFEDALELHNPNEVAVDIGGWYLTDDATAPHKFRIPPATAVPAHGYLAFDEHLFNDPELPKTGRFSLSDDGDEIYLLSADATGRLTGFVDGLAFGGAEANVSFGRHVTSTGQAHPVRLQTVSWLAPNGPFRHGPVVFSELMVHPPAGPGGTLELDNTEDEFIELQNVTGLPVVLGASGVSTSSWRLARGVNYDFPPGALIPAQGYVVVVSFDPFSRPDRLDTFRSRYDLPSNTLVYGPYEGRLSNDGERIELQTPTTDADGRVIYVAVDRIDYSTKPPWLSQGVAGFGAVLQRIDSMAYGNDPANWTEALPSPGRPRGPCPAPFIVSQPADERIQLGLSASLSVEVRGVPPLRYQWFRDRQPLPQTTDNVLSLPKVDGSNAGAYLVVVSNCGGDVTSRVAQLTIEDRARPTLRITSPRPGTRTTAESIQFRGVALDNLPLLRIEYSLNDGPFVPIPPRDDLTRWELLVPLQPGTNIVALRSVDQAGQVSLTHRQTVFRVVTAALSLGTSGLGRVRGLTHGQQLELGRAYSVTAEAGRGQFFNGWTGSRTGTEPRLTFLMESNFTLVANFVPSPFSRQQGSYHGLFYETNEVWVGSPGFFTFTLTDSGGYSALLRLAGQRLAVSGQLTYSGHGTNETRLRDGSGLTVRWFLAQPWQVRGTLGNEQWSAPLLGQLQFPGAVLYQGRYTFVIPGMPDSRIVPGGDGFGTLVIDRHSVALLTGRLADGSPIAQRVPIATTGLWPFYVTAYAGTGLALGWMGFFPNWQDFAPEPDSGPQGFTGDLTWICPNRPRERRYPAGFARRTQVRGSRYVPPVGGQSPLSIGQGELVLNAFQLQISEEVTLTPTGLRLAQGPGRLNARWDLKNGWLRGTYSPPTGPPVEFQGAVLQLDQEAAGYFLEPTSSGRMHLKARE